MAANLKMRKTKTVHAADEHRYRVARCSGLSSPLFDETDEAVTCGHCLRLGTPSTAIKITPVRIPPLIKGSAFVRARKEGRTLTDVVNTLLERYGKGEIDA